MTALLTPLAGGGYRFDTVLLVYVLNDIADLPPGWEAVRQRIYHAPVPGFLVRHSYLVNTRYDRYRVATDRDLREYYLFALDACRGPVWDGQARRLEAVVFPLLHAIGDYGAYGPIQETIVAFFRERGPLPRSPARLRRTPFERARRQRSGHASERGGAPPGRRRDPRLSPRNDAVTAVGVPAAAILTYPGRGAGPTTLARRTRSFRTIPTAREAAATTEWRALLGETGTRDPAAGPLADGP